MDVNEYQHHLAGLGYHDGACDGQYGPTTKSSIMKFQKEHRKRPDGTFLWVDGIWGPATEAALRQVIGSNEPPRVEDPPAVPSIPIPHDENAEPGKEWWWSEIEYFTPEDFMCKCRHYGTPHCNGWPSHICETTVRLADRGRKHFGKPGHVSSGLRDPIHNKNQGGVWDSLHMTGEACDIMYDGISPAECLAFFQAQPEVVYCYMIKDKYGSLTGYVHYNIARGAK